MFITTQYYSICGDDIKTAFSKYMIHCLLRDYSFCIPSAKLTFADFN